jgi:hypothetical protein
MNTVYVPQLNLYMKLVKTLIIKKTNLEDKLQVFWNGVPVRRAMKITDLQITHSMHVRVVYEHTYTRIATPPRVL